MGSRRLRWSRMRIPGRFPAADELAGALAVLDGAVRPAAARASWPGPPACRNRVAPEGTTTMPILAASASTRLPAESCEFSIASAEFCRWSASARSIARPIPGVELQQPELERDDPDQRERDERDPSAAADEAVEPAGLDRAGDGGDQAECDPALACALRGARGRRGAPRRTGYAPWPRRPGERPRGRGGPGPGSG